MSFSKFFRVTSAVAALAVNAAVQAQAQQNNQLAAMNAEQAEAAKWETRRQEAYAGIQRALDRHLSGKSSFGKTCMENKAIDLRREADTNCRNRSNSLMGYTEDRVASFEKYGH